VGRKLAGKNLAGREAAPGHQRLTPFEHILIGLLCGSSQSGYELKRYFATTPAVVYEPSSGALYPALRRLAARGLLHSELTTSSGGHEQHRYSPTQAGRETHRRWLRQPVDQTTVGRDLGVHLMRFAMAEGELTPGETLAFLQDLGDALGQFITDMETFMRDTPMPGRHAALALEHGLAVHRASLLWVQHACASLTESAGSGGAAPGS